jgi:hypothetical protein
MKQELIKRSIYMNIMLAFLVLSLFTEDVLISHMYAAISIIIGALTCYNSKNENNFEYE